jgi:hypothetical protein
VLAMSRSTELEHKYMSGSKLPELKECCVARKLRQPWHPGLVQGYDKYHAQRFKRGSNSVSAARYTGQPMPAKSVPLSNGDILNQFMSMNQTTK